MNLDEATRILRTPGRDMHEWSAAGSYVVSYYNEHRDKLRPLRQFTTDAVKPGQGLDAALDRYYERRGTGMARDQSPAGMGRYEFASSEQAPMGRLPEAGPAGAEMVMRLDGPITSYFIGPAPDGFGAALYRTVEADGSGDGRMSGGASPAAAAIRNETAFPPTARLGDRQAMMRVAMMRDARARDELRQAEGKSISKRVADFWRREAGQAANG